jgi:hypothetical protein
MNGKRARALRREAQKQSRKPHQQRRIYQALKREAKAENGQHPKPIKVRGHAPKSPIKATWPKTNDQKQQSRPLIVVHPIRQYKKLRPKSMIDHLIGLPKWQLDAAVIGLL